MSYRIRKGVFAHGTQKFNERHWKHRQTINLADGKASRLFFRISAFTLCMIVTICKSQQRPSGNDRNIRPILTKILEGQAVCAAESNSIF